MTKNPTKAELKAEIQKILKDANLEETAAKKVRLQLEKNLKCDLSNRKKEVDELVMDYVNSQASSDGEEDDDEEDDDHAGNGKGNKKGKKAKGNSDYEDDEEDEEEEDDDDDEDFSEEEKPKGRKSAGKRGTPAKRGPAKKKRRASNSEDDSGDDDKGSDDDYNPKGSGKGKAASKKKNNSDSDSDGDWKQTKPAAKAKKAAGGGGGAKRSNGYTRPYTLSPELAEVCGAESLPRHEVVKKMWAIIKERNLYDPKNRQFAICDEQLRKVIGVKRFRTFGMLKYLKPHFKD